MGRPDRGELLGFVLRDRRLLRARRKKKMSAPIITTMSSASIRAPASRWSCAGVGRASAPAGRRPRVDGLLTITNAIPRNIPANRVPTMCPIFQSGSPGTRRRAGSSTETHTSSDPATKLWCWTACSTDAAAPPRTRAPGASRRGPGSRARRRPRLLQEPKILRRLRARERGDIERGRMNGTSASAGRSRAAAPTGRDQEVLRHVGRQQVGVAERVEGESRATPDQRQAAEPRGLLQAGTR